MSSLLEGAADGLDKLEHQWLEVSVKCHDGSKHAALRCLGVSLQIYVGVTDHLWGKHCKREFKDARLLEYESWKEMYVRLSEEREMKLQRLTKSIVSAHSNKPKGTLFIFVFSFWFKNDKTEF